MPPPLPNLPPLELPSRPALLIIDMQNSFLHPSGVFQKTGLVLPPEKVEKSLAVIKQLRAQFNARKLPVIFSQYAFNDDYSDAGTLTDPFPMLRDFGFCKRGTWDAAIIDELKPVNTQLGEVELEKYRTSAFAANSSLSKVLEERDVNGLVVVGEATNVCVESTVRDATSRDWKCVVVKDGCVALTDEQHEMALWNMGVVFGRVAGSEEVVEALGRL